MTAERLLVIGGAALNPAVQAIAAQVFAEPVVVPEPGEYVALGASVQAAWADEAPPDVAGADRRLPCARPPPGDPRGLRARAAR